MDFKKPLIKIMLAFLFFWIYVVSIQKKTKAKRKNFVTISKYAF